MAKTKALISFAVTAKLICVFVFAYAKNRFSHDEAHIISDENSAILNQQLFLNISFAQLLVEEVSLTVL